MPQEWNGQAMSSKMSNFRKTLAHQLYCALGWAVWVLIALLALGAVVILGAFICDIH